MIKNVEIEKTNFDNIKDKYIEVFMNNLEQEEKEEIHIEQFIWHAFSYKKVSSLEGIEAINEFNKQNKNEVYLFFQENDDVFRIKNLTYEKLLSMMENYEIPMDCYVVDKDFNWTFVYTHETIADDDWYYIGPFFKSVKNS